MYLINLQTTKIYDKEKEKERIIKTLTRQAARWSTAAKQDTNPLISVLHANYGAGYLWALKDIFTDIDIENSMNIDILRFRDEIVSVQDTANLNLINSCDNLINSSDYLSKIAGEGI